MDIKAIMQELFSFSTKIRYVAIYHNNELVFEQRQDAFNSSSGSTDTYEELLVNPTVLTLARQRGNIDCGGLRHVIIGYGHFNQLIRETSEGHLSVCLEKDADLNTLPDQIFRHLEKQFPEFN